MIQLPMPHYLLVWVISMELSTLCSSWLKPLFTPEYVTYSLRLQSLPTRRSSLRCSEVLCGKLTWPKSSIRYLENPAWTGNNYLPVHDEVASSNRDLRIEIISSIPLSIFSFAHFQVRRSPPCHLFACLGSLANRTRTTVEVVVARSGRTLVSGSLAQLRPDLYSKGGGARITNELQLRDSYQLLSSKCFS